jgi:lambda family phage portal protein
MSDKPVVRIQAMVDTAYSGASVMRKELAQWTPVMEPPDAELLPEWSTLVARSRDLSRNHGIAASGFQTLTDNIVGTGFRLAATPDYRALGRTIEWAEEWSRTTESLWRAYADSTHFDAAEKLNFPQMTAMVLRTSMLSGEVFALPLWIEDPSTPFATSYQLIEGDRISNPNYQMDTDTLRGGIQINQYGRELAYYVRKSGGDMWMMPGYYTMTGSWERIPAKTPWGRRRVFHIYEQDRVEQTHGKPVLSSILEQFKMFDHYQRSELQSAIVNALVAGVIETPMDQAQIADLMGGDPNKYLEMKNQWKTQLKGGAMIPLYPGDKLTPFAPSRPGAQYQPYVETTLRHISTGLNLPYELLVKDFSKTNYSSARAALLEAWRFFGTRREWLKAIWCNPVYSLWLEEVVGKGLIEAPGYEDGYNRYFYSRAKWIGNGRGWIDPVKEAQAAIVRMDAGISTLEMECAEQGSDWVDVLEQRAREYLYMKKLKIYDVLVKPKNMPVAAGGGGEEETTPGDERIGQEGTQTGEGYNE